MVAYTLEETQLSDTKRNQYVRLILIALAGLVLIKTVWFSRLGSGPEPRDIVDFDAFHIAAQMVWRGEIKQAYHFTTLREWQMALSGSDSFMPWTYPPQFNLVVAPFALLPVGLAYILFTTVTLITYLAILRRIASTNLAIVLISIFPAIGITIACGQNGFLTGALIGLTCIGLQQRSAWAGVPLGLMVIKPHLAVAFAFYTLATRQWHIALIAATTIAITTVLTTAAFGLEIWGIFLKGVKEAGIFLELGVYPLFRMISPYSTIRSLGLPAELAFAVQIAAAILALASVYIAIRHRFNVRQTLGLTAVASLLISPYAYDYDLPIYGVGLALLLPDLIQLGSMRERATLYILSFVTGLFGVVMAGQSEPATRIGENAVPSVAGLTLLILLLLMWRILRRCHDRSTNSGTNPSVSTSVPSTNYAVLDQEHMPADA